jgi:hypothetical protein
MPGCNWTQGKGCTRQRKHKRNGFCQFHYNIWSRRQRINNNEALTNTATGGGGAQLINHETVGLTDNHLLSVTGDNDLSRVARRNTATGDDTLPISNETLSRTENCLPSSNSDNNVSIAAHGNTAISQIKKRVTARCKWTVGCINSLTPICVRAGTKNYRSVEFLRRNSTFFSVFRNTTQPPTTPHHGEPFALLRNELGGYAQSTTRATRPRVSARGLSLGFV